MVGRTGSVPHVARFEGCVMPVRRGSRAVGRFERLFWRPTSRRRTRLIVLAARRYELSRRQRGARNGPLGSIALEILDLMANLIDFRTGRLDPSLTTLMRLLKRSRDAIVRGLHNLRTHGFLDWMRRYATAGSSGKGPQVVQATNAYRLYLPDRAASPLGSIAKTPPLPDDWSSEMEQREERRKTYQATLVRTDLPFLLIDDTGLAESLARLARNMEKRESARRTEFRSD